MQITYQEQKMKTVEYSLADIDEQDKSINYIGGMFPKGKLSAIVGDSSVGKTSVLAAVSLTITDGDVFLQGNKSIAKNNGKVLFVDTDAGVDTFKRKVIDFCGSPERFILPKESGCLPSFSSTLYKNSIVECITEYQPDLVLIDSFAGFLGVNENSCDVIPCLRWLADIARKNNVAVAFTHLTNGLEKAEGRITLNCVRGFSAIYQIPPIIWGIDVLPGDSKYRKLYQIKNNLEALDTQEHIITLGESGISVLSNIPRNISAKSRRVGRYQLLEANKGKTTSELIKLLQQQDYTTTYEAAKKAVERWRNSNE